MAYEVKDDRLNRLTGIAGLLREANIWIHDMASRDNLETIDNEGNIEPHHQQMVDAITKAASILEAIGHELS